MGGLKLFDILCALSIHLRCTDSNLKCQENLIRTRVCSYILGVSLIFYRSTSDLYDDFKPIFPH